ncbi:MAG: Xaa-Pro peptidase family protein [Dehalococcoidia bacterium]|nr:Xaa-Pro peptidase family protein [Dehalococcoidia bacterium]MDW8119578.1 Xaa-Pro peptidase family protein [Chloroflexota bacterium]
MQTRLARLRAHLQDMGLDALLVSTPENRRWLSGFTGSAGWLLITPHEAVLATDFRYVEQAGQQAPAFRVVRIKSGYDWFPSLVQEVGARKVGFEAGHLTVATYHALVSALKEAKAEGVSLQATQGVVEALRMRKDPEELALIARAVAIADQALRQVAPTIREGETERAVAWRLERAMRDLGAEGVAFETIVASGPNAALPHHRAADRPIQAGEPIVIDFGARYQGYCSDLTRTFCLGRPSDTFRKVYDIVLTAQLTAMATIQAGMKAGDADSIARKIIEDAGYKENFGHSLGHGIGLAVHEAPRLGPESATPLEEGMVFTVEPGIYLSGWGGVRIEDTVVLENGKVRPLTSLPKHEDPRLLV